jgi:uncharacterized membrane protein
VSAGVAIGLLAATAGFVDFAALEENLREAKGRHRTEGPEGPAPQAPRSDSSPAEKAALRHMALMLTALGAYGMSLVFRHGSSAPEGALLVATLACDGVGVSALTVGGHFGGELVYRYGIGRIEPNARQDSVTSSRPRRDLGRARP